jgi:hypothetical protein
MAPYVVDIDMMTCRIRHRQELSDEEQMEPNSESFRAPEQGKDHNLQTEIVVNGRGRKVEGTAITFEAVVALAFPGTQPDPNVVFSVTFQRAAQTPTAGELGPGGIVNIKNGTRFNVTKTTKS